MYVYVLYVQGVLDVLYSILYIHTVCRPWCQYIVTVQHTYVCTCTQKHIPCTVQYAVDVVDRLTACTNIRTYVRTWSLSV